MTRTVRGSTLSPASQKAALSRESAAAAVPPPTITMFLMAMAGTPPTSPSPPPARWTAGSGTAPPGQRGRTTPTSACLPASGNIVHIRNP